MATQEKLLKSLEYLKQSLNSNQNATETQNKKKEKIQHCNYVADALLNPSVKVAKNFNTLFSFTFEVLLQLCDDPDADLRIIADESLNKIIRAMGHGNIIKVTFELLKVIRNESSSRTLRAALWRFALLAHQIRLNKAKAYITGLLPALIKIMECEDESVHETLSNSLSKIMEALGAFTSESETKMLLKGCLSNLQSPSAAIRRSSAASILTICLNFCKPFVFLSYVFNNLTEILVPVKESHSTPLILGSLACIKTILPHIKGEEINYRDHKGYKNNLSKQANISLDKYLQVYEICLHYLSHSDHNIANSCLETLNTFIQHMPNQVKDAVLSKSGIEKSRIFSFRDTVQTTSQLSVATTILRSEFDDDDAEDLFDADFSINDVLKGDLKLSLTDINLSKETLIDVDETVEVFNKLKSGHYFCEYSNMSIGSIEDSFAASHEKNVNGDLGKAIASENSSEKSFSIKGDEKSLVGVEDLREFEIDCGHFTDPEVSLIYVARYIISQFLLNGIPKTTVSDKNVRVSMKNLAFSVISSIVQLYPSILLKYLDKNGAKTISESLSEVSDQKISDILLYKDHSDPQIRGAVRIFIANFIKSVLQLSHGKYNEWISQNEELDFKNLIDLLLKGIQDGSSACSRQSLQSLNICLPEILKSNYSDSLFKILEFLPLMAKDPYWLVKVKLLDLIVAIDYINVEFVTNSNHFQSKVIHNILFELIGNEDQRVRNAAAVALVKIIPSLFFNCDLAQGGSIVTCKALQYKNEINQRDINESLPSFEPLFDRSEEETYQRVFIENSLSRILSFLYKKLIANGSKHFLFGYFETLTLLSYKYPTCKYKRAWNCFPSLNVIIESSPFPQRINPTTPKSVSAEFSSSLDLLAIIVHTFTSSIHAYDINFHANLVKLSGNLLAGKWLQNIKSPEEVLQENPRQLWDLLSDKSLARFSELFLQHIMKLLNIFTHIVEENSPVLPALKLPNLPTPSTSSSPLKRRKSDLGERKTVSPAKLADSDKKDNDKKESKMGFFAESPHYMKIYEILKFAYNNYKITLDLEASENFLGFLKATLCALSQILEIATETETGRITEEIIQYLHAVFHLHPSCAVQCVRQLVKSVFSNFDKIRIKYYNRNGDDVNDQFASGEFYHHLVDIPFKTLNLAISKLKESSKVEFEGDQVLMGYLHRKERKLTNNNDALMTKYLRIFETIMIESLKHYTQTSDVQFQCQVLQLLSRLITLRVNYCLLDSEQIFIDFVLKQLAFIENGQVPLPEQLIPKIFEFLVHLSYAKQHTKCIIVIPKIIQLCDGLMASGQCPETHCIPALKPVVVDVFLLRNISNTNDFKELETAREVLLVTLIKLIQYLDVINLLSLVLNESKYCKDGGERWIRWSKQVFDAFLLELKANNLAIESANDLETCKRLLFTLHSSVFNASKIVSTLFEQSLSETVDSQAKFLGKTNLLLFLLMQFSEEKLLKTISLNQQEIVPDLVLDDFSPMDPLNATKMVVAFEGVSPEDILVGFFFRVTKVFAKRVVNDEAFEDLDFGHFYGFLKMVCYILQCGSYKNVAQVGRKFVREFKDLKEVNGNFLKIGKICPLLTFQWCYVLSLLHWNQEIQFWAEIFKFDDEQIKNSDFKDKKSELRETRLKHSEKCLNDEIVKTGASIMFSEYLSESCDLSLISWFLTRNVTLLIELIDQQPVFDFLESIQKKSQTSSLFLDLLVKKCSERNSSKSSSLFKAKILECLENVHESQSGKLIKLLLPGFLESKKIAISRKAAQTASRKVEYLLTQEKQTILTQLTKEELNGIMDKLVLRKLVKKHEILIGLLNKLSAQFYDRNIIEFEQRRSIKPDYVKNLNINYSWYLSQVMKSCLEPNSQIDCAELLCKLTFEDIVKVMSDQNFNLKNIKSCLKWSSDNKKESMIKACAFIITKNVESLLAELPKEHAVFLPQGRDYSPLEMEYSQRLTNLVSNDLFFTNWINIIPSTTQLLALKSKSQWFSIPESSTKDFARFAVTSLEISSLNAESLNYFDVNLLSACLECAQTVFEEPKFCNCLIANVSWLCSSINSVYKIVSRLLVDSEPLPSLRLEALEKLVMGVENFKEDSVESQRQSENVPAGRAIYQIYILVCWLERVTVSRDDVRDLSKYLFQSVKSIVISLARLPLVNSFVLTPPAAWKAGWVPPECEDEIKVSLQLSPLPLEFLQEVDVLEEFIFRTTLLCWTSRTQFEETWVSLLSALNTTSSSNNTSSSSNDEASNEEDRNAKAHTNSLALQALTTLLQQTLYFPRKEHNKVQKAFVHVPRDSTIFGKTRCLRKLKALQRTFAEKLKQQEVHLESYQRIVDVFEKPNLEKVDHNYSYSQFSLEYFLIATKSEAIDDELTVNEQSIVDKDSTVGKEPTIGKESTIDKGLTNKKLMEDRISGKVEQSLASMVYNQRKSVLNDLGLDLNSCIQLMMDLFNLWLQSELPPRLLHQVVKSILYISDIFYEKGHFRWMLDTCLELSKTHSIEDEIVHQYLVIAVCKAASVITPENETLEYIKKLVQQSLKNTFLPTRVSALHGLSYLLQMCYSSKETASFSVLEDLFLPIATDYIICHITNTNSILEQSQEHTLLLWALAFFILENATDIDDNFTETIFSAVLNTIGVAHVSHSILLALIKGLERLIITNRVPKSTARKIVNYALSEFNNKSPIISLATGQLLFTSLYIEYSDHLNNTSGLIASNPDHLVQSIEKISAVFDKIKKGLPFEVEIFSAVLADLLIDFFSPSDILTKVISEFLSPQQRHPMQLSKIVFKVFENAIKQSQLSLLQDWVVLSLNNFTQSSSVGMATWSLTCFFISASVNEHLRNLFPYVQRRMGRYEYEDRKFLCIAGLDFYKKLDRSEQKRAFLKTLTEARNQADMPFNELLQCLQ